MNIMYCEPTRDEHEILKEVFYMGTRNLGGLFDNCAILFFIILFLLLFWNNGPFNLGVTDVT